jgi:predicted TPR repeat methyltransferase
MDKSKNAVELFDEYAQRYADKFMDQSRYHDVLHQFCMAINPADARVLDVACGPGNITRYLLDQKPGLKISGLDLSERMLVIAQQANPTADFRLYDARQISGLKQSFHAIVCGFGLPYFNKEEAIDFIAQAARSLHPQGLLYFSTMEDLYENSNWKGPSSGEDRKIFIHYHEADYLTRALDQNDFEILKLKRQAFPEPDGSESTDLIILARKGS